MTKDNPNPDVKGMSLDECTVAAAECQKVSDAYERKTRENTKRRNEIKQRIVDLVTGKAACEPKLPGMDPKPSEKSK